MFIVLVMREQFFVYSVVQKQSSAGSGVLGQYDIGFPQNVQRPQGDVLQVSNWGWNKGQQSDANKEQK